MTREEAETLGTMAEQLANQLDHVVNLTMQRNRQTTELAATQSRLLAAVEEYSRLREAVRHMLNQHPAINDELITT